MDPSLSLVTPDGSPSVELAREDYIETLLRDPTSSHLVEVLLSHSPPRVFRAVWSIYFHGRLSKLATHPVANYVVAKAVARLDGDELGDVMEEMKGAFGRTVKLGRTGVQKALVERAASTQKCESEVIDVSAILLAYSVFWLVTHVTANKNSDIDAGAHRRLRLRRRR